MGALFEIARGTFSTVYGCSVMYQLKETPEITKPKISSFFQQDKQLSAIFNECFLGENNDPTLNFYFIFDDVNTRISLQQFLEFMDGIKMLHEDVASMVNEYDTKYTEGVVQDFKELRSGLTADFGDVQPNLNQLNEYFECSETIYTLHKDQCGVLPPDKTTCIDVHTGTFDSQTCVNQLTASRELFNNLKAYMIDEAQLMEEMVYQLDGQNNPNSILSMIKKTYLEFNEINKKIQSLDSELDSHFNILKSGPIETWLDCGVIHDEIYKSFNNICTDKLEDMSNFANMNLGIILICYSLMVIYFILTFCFKDEKDFIEEIKQENQLNYQNMEESEEDIMEKDTTKSNEDDIEHESLNKKEGLQGKEMKKDEIGL